MEIAQGRDGGGVLGDGLVVARGVPQHLADREIDQRGGDRTPSGRGELGAGDAFGEARRCDQLDRGDTAVATQPSSCRDADRVGRDDHRDRCQRVIPLGRGDRVRERGQRCVGAHGCAANRHVVDRTQRVREGFGAVTPG